MSDAEKSRQRHQHLVASHIGDLSAEIEEDLEAGPTADVILAVLATTIKASQECWFDAVDPGNVLGFEWKDAVGRSRSTLLVSGKVADFGDHVFVRAADFLGEITARLEIDNGKKPSLEEFCKLIVSSAAAVKDGVSFDDVLQLKPRVARGSSAAIKRAKIGDIVEIPAQAGGAYRAVVVARNNMGTAYGILSGPEKHMQSPPRRIVPLAVYSGDNAIKEGRWTIVGHDDAALELFPKVPEIYFRKQDPFHVDDPEIGEFGAAKAPGGTMRQVSKEEAAEVGLLNGDYNQGYLEPFLETWLDANRSRLWPVPH